MTTTTTAPTAKQAAFAASLVDEIGRLSAQVYAARFAAGDDNAPEGELAYRETVIEGYHDALADADRRETSTIIDSMIIERDRLRDRLRELPTPEEVQADEPTEGIHAIERDGTIEVRKVQAARQGSGRLYAKRLDPESGRWDYLGRRGLEGLSDATRMTREQAERFGALYGMCGVCGATLTDEDSIERGIGPVCATRVE